MQRKDDYVVQRTLNTSRPKSGGSGGTAKYYSNGTPSAPNKNYETLVNLELFGFGGGDEAVLQRDQDGLAIFSFKPVVGFDRRLRADGVWVQILLEQVGLHRHRSTE
ncbi:hypothetical protein EYF80_019755 [Liparis tanakae]|uniref:Uncharacterized protein n=1 Tax=Liparis tanakae TaxID=230148 RepID=A0A4Z2HW64_9TELE|nr:hypothetical protein EYF80_019755 [Liparis tanakae]